MELLVATDPDNPGKVISFLLYLPVQGDREACSVAYMAVHAGHRRQSVDAGMMDEVVTRYPHAELTCCSVGKVP